VPRDVVMTTMRLLTDKVIPKFKWRQVSQTRCWGFRWRGTLRSLSAHIPETGDYPHLAQGDISTTSSYHPLLYRWWGINKSETPSRKLPVKQKNRTPHGHERK